MFLRRDDNPEQLLVTLPDERIVPVLEAHLGQQTIDTTRRSHGIAIDPYLSERPMKNSAYGYVLVDDEGQRVWWEVEWGALTHQLEPYERPILPVRRRPVIGRPGGQW